MFVKKILKTEDDPGTGTLMVEKMMKKDHIIPSPSHIYAESMLYAILELILWHKYKTREKKQKKDILPLIKAP